MALTEVDRNLLKRCLNHEPGAWQDFVDRFLGLIAHVIHHTAGARSIPLTPDDVDDICAEVLLTVVANNYALLRHFRGQSSLATYLTVVCRRVCLRALARQRRTETPGPHTSAMATGAEDHKEPAEKVVLDREQVEQMIDGLEEKEARIVRLFHLEGKSYRDISGETGIPENTIGPILARARAKMRHTAQKPGKAALGAED